MPIDRQKIALLHIAKNQLGLDDDQYRAALRNTAGVGSSTELSDAGFHAAVEYFNALGFVSTARKRNFGDRRGMASSGQVGLIRTLWREFTGADDEAGLSTWLERTAGVSNIRFLDPAGAQKAITGLRAMIKRKCAAKTESEALPCSHD